MTTRVEHKDSKHSHRHSENGDDQTVNNLYNEVERARQNGSDDRTTHGGTYSNSEGVRNALTSANQYIHSHGFPNVFITGTGRRGELLGQDDHGQKVHVKDGHGGKINVRDDGGREVKGDNQTGDGTGTKIHMPNDQGGGKINDDGSGTYNVNFGKKGVWGGTAQALEDQAHQGGFSDYHASNRDIANAEQRMAFEAGYRGKHAVDEWAKHVKPGEIHLPSADYKSPAFSEASKGRGEVAFGGDPNREVQKKETDDKTKHEIESGRVNDSRPGHYGGNFITDTFHSWGWHDAANALDWRTSYKTDKELDANGVKKFTTKYTGDGAEIKVRAASNGQEITLSNVTESRGERAAHGKYKMTWVVNGKEHHGHMAPDGNLEFDE